MKRKKGRVIVDRGDGRLSIYPEMTMTVKEFIEKFHYHLCFLYLILCLFLFLLLGINSLPVIIIVILTCILNAYYTAIKKPSSTPSDIGNWKCAAILKRALFGIMWGYILFSISVVLILFHIFYEEVT